MKIDHDAVASELERMGWSTGAPLHGGATWYLKHPTIRGRRIVLGGRWIEATRHWISPTNRAEVVLSRGFGTLERALAWQEKSEGSS